MKQVLSYFIAATVTFSLISCGDTNKDPARFVGFAIYDSNWTDTMLVQSLGIRHTNITITGKPQSSSWINRNLSSAFDPETDITNTQFSQKERFAMGIIRERSSILQEYYENSIYASYMLFQHFLNIYIRESPRVVADKSLFGKGPGEDLSSFFEYTGQEMKCLGPDYQVAEPIFSQYSPDPRIPRPCALTTYFTEGAMMPKMFGVRSTIIPEELSDDDDITLTFIFPVTIEHYWSWLLELYENPDAEESFTNTDMILKVYLKDLKKYGGVETVS